MANPRMEVIADSVGDVCAIEIIGFQVKLLDRTVLTALAIDCSEPPPDEFLLDCISLNGDQEEMVKLELYYFPDTPSEPVILWEKTDNFVKVLRILLAIWMFPGVVVSYKGERLNDWSDPEA